MAITPLALPDSTAPHGDQDLVGGGELHRAQPVEDELDRDIGVVHRSPQPGVSSPHTARRRRDIIEATTCPATVAPHRSAICGPRRPGSQPGDHPRDDLELEVTLYVVVVCTR